MPDATYVGAGMPCGNCGNPLTLGQPHKCGRTPDFDRRLDESWEPSPAASPDEQLREAADDALALLEAMVAAGDGSGDAQPDDVWRMAYEFAIESATKIAPNLRAALAAADREAHLEPAPQNDATRAQIVAAKLIANREAPDERVVTVETLRADHAAKWAPVSDDPKEKP